MAKIVFLQLNEYELHGTQSIAAVLRAHGHSSALAVPGFEQDPMAAILRADPDVIGIGLTTVERAEALLWAQALKKRTRALVILGGIDPTFHPRLALEPGVDGVIRGEAEYSTLELMDRVTRGEDIHSVPALAYNQGGELSQNPVGGLIQDLDTLPFPDKDLYLGRYQYFRDFPIKLFMAGRGCPYDCGYCANRGLRALYDNPGHYVRFKSPAYLLAEIKAVLQTYPARILGFNDDLFTLKLSWLQEFLPRYQQEIGIPFFCTCRIDAMSDDKAALLADAGCYTSWYGLETADPETREQVLGRNMSNDDIARGTEILHRHGITAQSYNILNIPGETFEQGLATLRLNIRVKNRHAVTALFQPFPGTAMTDRLVQQGLIKEPDKLGGREKMSYFAFSPFQQKDTARFHNLQKLFLFGLWFPRLIPLIARLCALPPNPLFDILFLGSFAINYKGTHRLSAWEVIHYNLRHVWTTYLARSRFVPPDE
ncbi:MAG TPA: radical SAM protein [bacterium]|nr:radical SAM protein [bacterium]